MEALKATAETVVGAFAIAAVAVLAVLAPVAFGVGVSEAFQALGVATYSADMLGLASLSVPSAVVVKLTR